MAVTVGNGDVDVHRFGLVVVGGGPAGMAPFLAAAREGTLRTLLARRVAVVEAGAEMGSGALGSYDLDSDTTAETFAQAVEALAGHDDPLVSALGGHPVHEAVVAREGRPVPLTDAAALLALVGGVLREAIEDAGGAVLVHHEAMSAGTGASGGWATRVRCTTSGLEAVLVSDALVLATGGVQDEDGLSSVEVAGTALAPTYSAKTILSDRLFRRGGTPDLAERLRQLDRVRVVVVGGGASALSAAAAVVDVAPRNVPVGWVTILHRRPVRLFYPSVAAAASDGYSDFGPDDVCPVHGSVYTLTGVRQVAPVVRRAVLGMAPDPRGTRVRLHGLDQMAGHHAHWLMRQADLVVACTGYRPRLLPVHDGSGNPVPLAGGAPGTLAADQDGRMLAADGRPVDGLYGIGLGYAPPSRDDTRSEPGHMGPLNDVARWNTGTGLSIARSLMADAA